MFVVHKQSWSIKGINNLRVGTSPWLYKPGMPSQKFIYPSKLLISLILMLSNGHELSLIYFVHEK